MLQSAEKVDFHCHSTASDGVLSPAQLLERAIGVGVDCLALTDHDTIAGTRWLVEQGVPESIHLIPGCEISTLWGSREIHIVALGFDLDNPDMLRFLTAQGRARWQRFERIAEKVSRRLPEYSLEQCLEGALGQARQAQEKADPNFVLDDQDIQIGRPHFASWMVQQGLTPDRNAAFDKYLSAKRIGNAKQHWPAMADTVQAILSWGAVPVLAHPGRYRMTGMKLQELIRAFSQAGGLAMEVVGCQQPHGERETMAKYCEKFSLHGSMGSDFHGPWSDYVELGRLGPLPESCTSVTELLLPA
ncbi:PHP domain-containing protein [Sansalvadorimonas verongulae]|uniref:PHP domain-containing protein n=1 Tax=Sansalvadorimonas verongulae TaxID=2172824 RepID=UPI0012BB77F0|nr:PHP domain-containing protein [Sansalvadorimonas verongulae]MTI12997.1 PHP domain-containing protein [Sansalvadorimonas verongulae]